MAGHLGHTDPRVLLAEIRRILADIPSDLRIPDQCLLRSLLGQAVSRLVRISEIDKHPAVPLAFCTLASVGFTPGHWQREFARLLDGCGAALEASPNGIHSAPHGQVEQALRVIDSRFSEVHLTLKSVANDVGLSSFHLSRLLHAHTGHGFVLHLHRRRVSAARRLLMESSLSVKEVAAEVGYRSVTQLGRQFKRFCGSTPISIRSRKICERSYQLGHSQVRGSQDPSTLRNN
jgi:AraC-like DNA-binding protein